MTPVLSVSVSGLQDAASRLATSAARVAKTAADRGRFDAPKQPTSASVPNALAGGPSRTTELVTGHAVSGEIYTPSYAEDLIAMRMAVQSYKANAKMISRYVEMEAQLRSDTGTGR